MRVVATELRQVFKAYTRQLRQASARDGEKSTDAVQYRCGFEKVDLSAEARELAASSRETEESEALDDPQEDLAEQE